MRNFIFIFLALALLIIPATPTLISYAFSNAGFLMLNRQAAGGENLDTDRTGDFFQSAASFNPSNAAGRRGSGYAFLAMNELEAAQSEFSAGGFSVEDLILFGDRANRANDLQTAVDWLVTAELMDAATPWLWQVAGKVCQKDPAAGSLCDRYLENNEQNWLVNSEFTFGYDGWHVRDVEGFDLHFGIEPCPDDVPGQCAKMSAGQDLPEHGISWSQCVKLEPGKEYRFSTWILADVEPDSEWRPVYLQGSIDGVPRGIWSGDQMGPAAWTYWEQMFTMPEFDDNLACFSPARLMGSGQIWFNRSNLTQLAQ